MPRPVRRALPAALLLIALTGAALAVPALFGPALPGGAPPALAQQARVRWEYKLLTWEAKDTEAVLREITGEELTSVEDMVTALANQLEPQNDTKLQRAVELRLAAHLGEQGDEGWEAFWVRESTVIVSGHVLPAPSVLLRRRK